MYLLDTCVISDLVSRRPDPGVLRWLDDSDEDLLHLSVITIGEIQKGIARLTPSARRIELEDWLEKDLLFRFSGRILPIDAPVMQTWGRLVAGLESDGRKLPAIDSMIAALVLHHRLVLVTRNTADFEGAGIDILNPWAQR